MALVPTVPLPTGDFGAFPPRGEGAFPSAGDIDIWWREPTPDEVFRLADRRQSSTHIFGEDTGTTVWRSDPVVLGTDDDVFGVPVGPSDSEISIAASGIRLVPQAPVDPRAGKGSRRRVYAELHSLQMTGGAAEILAGDRFLDHLDQELGLSPVEISRVFRRSYGEVISWDLTGDPGRDFPADNHFNVFFAVKFDESTTSPAFTVFNREPLVVVDLGVTGLPPFDRVTIPQFPYDLPKLYYVRDPLDRGGIGEVLAGRGGCCAHAVRISADLVFRPVGFEDLAGGLKGGDGIDLRTGETVLAGTRSKTSGGNRPGFRALKGSYVDGVFVPNGVTQIARSGLTFEFEDTCAGEASDAVRNGVASVNLQGESQPISVQAPTDALAYQPPQTLGLGLGPNGGITFDVDALRRDNPDFYLVSLVALEGLNGGAEAGASARLRVLVDGVEVPFASRSFDVPGKARAISVDLQTAQRYVTLVSTSTRPGAEGVFALFQLRGFGALAGEAPLDYTGPARPDCG